LHHFRQAEYDVVRRDCCAAVVQVGGRNRAHGQRGWSTRPLKGLQARTKPKCRNWLAGSERWVFRGFLVPQERSEDGKIFLSDKYAHFWLFTFQSWHRYLTPSERRAD